MRNIDKTDIFLLMLSFFVKNITNGIKSIKPAEYSTENKAKRSSTDMIKNLVCSLSFGKIFLSIRINQQSNENVKEIKFRFITGHITSCAATLDEKKIKTATTALKFLDNNLFAI